MKTCYSSLLLLTTFSLLLLTACKGKPREEPIELKVCNLKCEYLTNPVVIDNPAPLLSWQLQSDKRGKRQTAYRIFVSDTLSLLAEGKGNYWDSGVVKDSLSAQIRYAGKPLTSREQLYWKVQVWDEQGQAFASTDTVSWTMGLLQPSDWSARWIANQTDSFPDRAETGPAPFFRKAFTIDKEVKKAMVYVCGLGFYRLYLDRFIVGDEGRLAPAVTNYDVRPLKHLIYQYDDQSTQRCLYNASDITEIMQKGQHVIGAALGNGWYNQRDRTVEGWMWYNTPRVIVQLELEYTDGTRQVIGTDTSWKTTTGPILHNGIFTGEVYDARKDLGPWTNHDYDDSNWQSSVKVKAPTGALQPQLAPFDMLTGTISLDNPEKENDSTYLYTLPYTISGWVKLIGKVNPNDQIKFRFISEEGDDYGQSDTFISGDDVAWWEPSFTWHTFRFVRVVAKDVNMDNVVLDARLVNTHVEQTGHFECSNELFNKIHTAYLRTQKANFHGSISSDCPHRERLGYTGDGQVIAETCLLTYDMTQFHRKWLNDMDDARNKKTGFVTHTAPFGGGGGGPAWGSAFVIMPWAYYCYYGDKTLLEQHYDGMKQWVDYLATRTDARGIVVREEPNGWCLGDWCTPDKIQIPEPLVNTAYYYHCTRLMSRIASELGRETDAATFDSSAVRIKECFNTAFYNPATHHYWEGRQGADVFALAFDLVPDENKQDVFNALLKHLESIDYHFDTGILATPLLLNVLERYDRPDIAYQIMNQREAPGYAYLLDEANSTLWENWDGTASRCHPMFGSVVTWFYRSLAGINYDEAKPGMKHILIKPQVTGDMTSCKGSFRSLYGLVRSEWEKEKEGPFKLVVEIPANTTATVYLPNQMAAPILESGIPAEQVKGVRMLGDRNGKSVLEVSSGTYTFTVK